METFFFGLHLNLGKKSINFGEDLFFGFHLICSPEKDRGQGSSPQCSKWGKIGLKLQIIPPNAQQRFAPLILRKSNINLPNFVPGKAFKTEIH